MNRLNIPRALLILGFGFIMLAAIPALGLFLAVGWAWRLWNDSIARITSFAFHQHNHRAITR